MSRSVMPQLVDPGDAGLHLVDHALHPEPEDAELRRRRMPSALAAPAGVRPRDLASPAPRSASSASLGRATCVAQPDQLRALVAQRLEDRPDLGQRAFASSRS